MQFADLIFWAALFPEVAVVVGARIAELTAPPEPEPKPETNEDPRLEVDPLRPEELRQFRKWQSDNRSALLAGPAKIARPPLR